MLYAFYKAVDNKAWDDIPGNNIMLATLAPEIGSTWITETIAPYSFAGDFSRLVMDADDHPHLTSQDFSSEDIRYTYWDGTAWHDELVALDSRGNLNGLGHRFGQ